jgi:signal transduction histidine kinase
VLSATFLRRIDAVNRTSRAIVDGNLAARVPTRGTDDELDQLAINLNAMLDRIQTLMEGLRQVSNDIAHDLRTPLGRLRQRLEATRHGAKTVAEYEIATEAALKETDAILETFSALLRIAQIEAGTRRSAFANVDLSDLVRSVAETYAPVAEEMGDAIGTNVVDDVTVKGDRQLLVQMLANLVENAIRHTPRGTTIRITLTHGPNGIEVRIADDGPGIPETEREKVFRRFYRLEQSRTTPGGGLGLALVKAVADLHGISMRLENRRPGLEVVLVLPTVSRTSRAPLT